METAFVEQNGSLMVDGNALAGLLQQIFDVEMTASPVECASCGREGEVGSLWAFPAGPGFVLRCPTCQQIILRVVVTPQKIYLDARGAAYICVPVS
jgi:hypothetical protein